MADWEDYDAFPVVVISVGLPGCDVKTGARVVSPRDDRILP